MNRQATPSKTWKPDIGIALLQRILREHIKRRGDGLDPMNVGQDPRPG
jgi:hypothetical protein